MTSKGEKVTVLVVSGMEENDQNRFVLCVERTA